MTAAQIRHAPTSVLHERLAVVSDLLDDRPIHPEDEAALLDEREDIYHELRLRQQDFEDPSSGLPLHTSS